MTTHRSSYTAVSLIFKDIIFHGLTTSDLFVVLNFIDIEFQL